MTDPTFYKIHFTETSLKEFKKLGATIQAQFKKKLKTLQSNPHIPSARLHGDLANCYKIKLRSAGYRLVYEVKDDLLIIVVIAAAKRQTIYDTAKERLPVDTENQE